MSLLSSASSVLRRLGAVSLLGGLFAFTACSSSDEQVGWGLPEAQKTESMSVTYADFLLKPSKKTISLRTSVELLARPSRAKFLIFEFPDPAGQQSKECKVVPLDDGQVYLCTSSALRGMKYHESYPITIRLTADRAGEDVLEELTQPVRFELPPKVAEQLGIEL